MYQISFISSRWRSSPFLLSSGALEPSLLPIFSIYLRYGDGFGLPRTRICNDCNRLPVQHGFGSFEVVATHHSLRSLADCLMVVSGHRSRGVLRSRVGSDQTPNAPHHSSGWQWTRKPVSVITTQVGISSKLQNPGRNTAPKRVVLTRHYSPC